MPRSRSGAWGEGWGGRGRRDGADPVPLEPRRSPARRRGDARGAAPDPAARRSPGAGAPGCRAPSHAGPSRGTARSTRPSRPSPRPSRPSGTAQVRGGAPLSPPGAAAGRRAVTPGATAAPPRASGRRRRRERARGGGWGGVRRTGAAGAGGSAAASGPGAAPCREAPGHTHHGGEGRPRQSSCRPGSGRLVPGTRLSRSRCGR